MMMITTTIIIIMIIIITTIVVVVIIIIIIIIIIIVVVMVIIIIMSYFQSAFPGETCSVVLNSCQYKNAEDMHIRHPKQQVSKQSYPSTQ